MQRKLLCYGPFCYSDRIKHDRDKLITQGRKNYCKPCWKRLEQEREDRSDLYHFIQRKAMIRYPTGMMLRDIKKYQKVNHYTYLGILVALEYADKFVMKFDFRSPFFLHFIPYVYDKAQRWHYKREHHNNLMLNADRINNHIDYAEVDPQVFRPKKKIPYYDMSKF